jgi:hypothetical protein
MANLVVSSVCNRRCSYCFAVDYLGGGTNPTSDVALDRSFLSLAAYEQRLDFLARSGIDEVRLLGGEPTLHPQFPELVRLARASGRGVPAFRQVVVFTNGLMPPESLEVLAALSPGECTVLVNVTPVDGSSDDGSLLQQQATIRQLGERVILGVNLYRTDLELGFLLLLVAESGCKKAIRVGLAQPCLSGINHYLVPNQYRSVAQRLLRFARTAAREGVTLDLDCGFVRCMFSDAELEELRALGSELEWRCNPILDIDLQGDVIHCFPLAQLARLPLAPDSKAGALRLAFEERTSPYRQAGVFRECSTCAFKARGDCTGGCLATTIRRFRHTPFRLRVTDPDWAWEQVGARAAGLWSGRSQEREPARSYEGEARRSDKGQVQEGVA